MRGARSTDGTASKSVKVILRQCRRPLWPSLTRVRRLVIALFGAAGVALLPWTVWLSSSLPPHHRTENWDLAWSVFDSVLAVSFLLTAFAAWHRRPWLPAAAAATGALLLADAWFDVILESRSDDLDVALIEAFLGELPIALVCFWVAYVTSRVDRRAPDPA
jgi:hypothetical protein